MIVVQTIHCFLHENSARDTNFFTAKHYTRAMLVEQTQLISSIAKTETDDSSINITVGLNKGKQV